NGVVWFDEYNAKLGTATTVPPTSAWQKGVWRRDFTNGIALVNPKGNGAQTVQLGGTFVKLKGSQAPTVNSGQTVTSVTLQDRDGIILLRQAPLKQPMAPPGISTEHVRHRWISRRRPLGRAVARGARGDGGRAAPSRA